MVVKQPASRPAATVHVARDNHCVIAFSTFIHSQAENSPIKRLIVKIAKCKTILHFIQPALRVPHYVRRVYIEQVITDANVEAADNAVPLIGTQYAGAEAWVSAPWPAGKYFRPPLSSSEKHDAQLEGWILGAW